MVFGRSRWRNVSSQSSIFPVFLKVGGRFGGTYCFRYSGLARAVVHVFACVCRTLGIVRDCFDAASRTHLRNRSHHC